VAQHIIQAVPPRLVGVATNIDALDELQLPGLHVLHVEVDVKDEITHLLHGSPGDPFRTNPRCKVTFAAVAVADLGPSGDFLLYVGRDRD
jgi:hypothetical protein